MTSCQKFSIWKIRKIKKFVFARLKLDPETGLLQRFSGEKKENITTDFFFNLALFILKSPVIPAI